MEVVSPSTTTEVAVGEIEARRVKAEEDDDDDTRLLWCLAVEIRGLGNKMNLFEIVLDVGFAGIGEQL